MENARDYLHCEHWPSNEHNGLSLNKFSLRFIYVITCIHIHCASVMRTRWVNAIVATFNAKSRARCEYGLMRVYVLGSKNCGRLNFNFNWSILKIYFFSSLSHRQHSNEPRQTKLKISLTFVFICLVSVGFNWRQSVCVYMCNGLWFALFRFYSLSAAGRWYSSSLNSYYAPVRCFFCSVRTKEYFT